MIILVTEGRSSSRCLTSIVVGIGSSGQDFLLDKIVARTSLFDKRLNSGKETSVTDSTGKALVDWWEVLIIADLMSKIF